MLAESMERAFIWCAVYGERVRDLELGDLLDIHQGVLEGTVVECL